MPLLILSLLCLPLFVVVVFLFAAAGAYSWLLVAPFLLKLFLILLGAFPIAYGVSALLYLVGKQAHRRWEEKERKEQEQIDPEKRRQLWLREQRIKAEVIRREAVLGRRMNRAEKKAFLDEWERGEVE